VPGRLHWPCHGNLTLNNLPLSIPCRSAAADLGRNGRDAPAVLASPPLLAALRAAGAAGEGVTLRVCLAGYDARPFALAARVARARSLPELRACAPPPPPFAEALRRAVRCAAPDEAAEVVVAGGLPVALRCPLSAQRIREPVRYRGCSGMAAFDLDALLQTAGRSRRWVCPLCAASGPPSALQRDPYLAAVLAILAAGGAADSAVEEVVLQPCGGWRARLRGGGLGRLVSAAETEAAARGALSGRPATEAEEGSGKRDREPGCEGDGWRSRRAPPPIEVIDLLSDSESEEESPPPAAPEPLPPPLAPLPSLPTQMPPAAAMPSAPKPLVVTLKAPETAMLLPRMPPSTLEPSTQPQEAEAPKPSGALACC